MSTMKWLARFADHSFSPMPRRIAKLFTVTVLSCILAYSQTRANIVAGYYQTGGALPLSQLTSNYVWSHLDYLFYAFATINTSSNTCELTATANVAADLSTLQQIRKSNPNLRILISIGGEDTPPTYFQTAANSTNVSGFVTSCVDTFISGKGSAASNIFDGIDVDWEFPLPGDQANYNNLLYLFRQQLGTGMLTAAILPTQCPTCNSDIDFGTAAAPGAAKWVDFFNVMAYNYAGPWSGADPSNAPIGHIMSDINNLIPSVPADKIVLGIPFYGINYAGYAAGTTVTSYSSVAALIAQGKEVTVDSTGAAVTLSYAGIKSKNLTAYYDSTQPAEGSGSTQGWDYESAWAYDSTNKVLWNYDDQNTIAAKGSWALTRTNLYDRGSNGSNTAEPLAGIMSWDFSQDNTSNTLLCAMEKSMKPSGTEVCTASAPSVPSVVSAAPNPASGPSNTFALEYSDTGGNAALTTVAVIFNPSVSSKSSCYAYYAPATNRLYLQNDAGTGATFITPGSGTLSNSQCTITGSGTSLVKSGNNLTLNLDVTASGTFTGSKNVFLYAADSSANSGWVNKGTWTPSASFVPSVGSVTPNPASGPSNTFALEYSDTGGNASLTVVAAIFNASVSSKSSCYAYYAPASNLLYLQNDAGTGATSITPGSGMLSNSQCTISGSGASVVKSGNNLTLNLDVTASGAFTGAKSVFLYAADNSSAKTGWVKKGTWTP